MLYREKIAVAGLIVIQLVYGAWWSGWIGLSIVGTIFLHVVVLTVAQLVIAWRTKPEPSDERDRSIELLAGHNAYYVAVIGAATTLLFLLWGTPPIHLSKLLMATLQLTEMTRLATQVFAYRQLSAA